MAMTKDDLMEAIKGLSVLELSELVKALEEEFGVSAAAPVGRGRGTSGRRRCGGGGGADPSSPSCFRR